MYKNLFTYIIIIFINLSFSTDIVNITDNTNTKLNIINKNNTSIEFYFELGNILLTDHSINNSNYIELSIPGFHSSNKLGHPKLPEVHKLLEVPYESNPKIEILNIEYEEQTYEELNIFNPIMPLQPSLSKSQNKDDVEFIINNDIYLTNAFQNKSEAIIIDKGFLRSVKIANLVIQPIDCNPIENKIKFIKSMSFKIYFENANTELTKETKNNYYSPYFEPIYNQIINYDPPVSRDDMINDPVTYLIVANEAFRGHLDDFIDWKTKKGYIVVPAYLDEIGSSASAIRSFIMGLYNSGSIEIPSPTFVLLVGDTNQLPASYSSGGHVSDLDYADFTNDNIPDVFIGRFSAQNPTQLNAQVQKTIEYEKFEMSDPSFLEDVIMISGVDASYAPTYGNGQINYGNSYYFNNQHGISSHTYLYPESGSSSNQILSLANQGAAFMNYTAHGWESGWADPEFDVSDANAMTNSGKYPTMVGNCCLTNAFDSGVCFGEALLRNSNGGAIGYIGGSDVTYWNEDYWWGVGSGSITSNPSYNNTGSGTYDGIFHENSEDYWAVVNSAIIFLGNMAVAEANGMDDYYWEIYHLMGDPALSTYFGIPYENEVSYAPFINIGVDEITVYATPHSYVGISRDGTLHGSGVINNSGQLTLNIEPFYSNGEADIVVTNQNYIPYIGTITIGSTDGAYLVMDSYELSSTDVNAGSSLSVNLTFENIGNDDASDISISLSSTSDYISIQDGSDFISYLSSGNSATAGPFIFDVSGNAPFGHQFSLDFTFGTNDDSWNSSLNMTVGELIESFETGDFTYLPWEFSGESDWTIEFLNASTGSYSARSGVLQDAEEGQNITSDLTLAITTVEDGAISFAKKISCEDLGSSSGNYYDYLAFYIDGVEQDKWAGESDWSTVSFAVSSGEHELTWKFNKDQGASSGDDAVWIDNIIFPPCDNLSGSTLGDLNSDGSINVLDVITLVNMILGNITPDYSSGDLNLDNQLNVLDIVMIVNIILSEG